MLPTRRISCDGVAVASAASPPPGYATSLLCLEPPSSGADDAGPQGHAVAPSRRTSTDGEATT